MYLRIFFCVLCLFSSLWASSASAQRFGFVYSDSLLTVLPEYANAEKQLKKKVSAWEQELALSLREVEKAQHALAQRKALLHGTAEANEQAKIDAKLEAYLLKREELLGPGGKADQQEEYLLRPIREKIAAAVRQVAQRKKIHVVFDKSSNFLMLHSDAAFNLNKEVLELLQPKGKK